MRLPDIHSTVSRLGFPISLMLLLLSSASIAAPLTLPQLDPSQTDDLLKTVAADLSFHPLEPSSSYGRIWGLSVGTEANATSTSQISSLLPSGPNYIPAADIYLGMQLPFGLALEGGFFPHVSLDGGTFSDYGGAVKWTYTDLLESRYRGPISSSLRLLYSHAALNYGESLDGANVDVAYLSHSEGVSLGTSLHLSIVEPYIDLGWITQSGSISGSGSVSLFNTNFPIGTESVSSSTSSVLFDAGVQLHLLMMAFTVEYSNRFGVNTYAGKFSFKF